MSRFFKWKSKPTDTGLSLLVQTERPTLKLDAYPELKEQMGLIGLTIDDLVIIKACKPFMKEHIKEIVSTFYDKVFAVPNLRQIIQQYSTVDRLKKTLTNHILEMFNGDINDEYIQTRIKVARMHFKVGVEPKWYMGAFQQVQEVMTKLVNHEKDWTKNDQEKAVAAIAKLISLETQLVLEEHEKEHLKLRERQYEQVKSELKGKLSLLSEDLAELAEETSTSVQQMIAHTNEIDRNIQSNAERVKQIQVDADDGSELVHGLESQITSIATSTENMGEMVGKLKDSSDKITQIIAMVKQIADQTNLLALNATIEAARAGTQGKGFAVVAQEVRKLAEQSKQSVEQITELIQASTALTDQAVATTADIKGIVGLGLDSSTQTQMKFKQILGSIDQNNQQINQVKEDMKKLIQVIQEIGNDTSKVAITAGDLYHTTVDL